MSDHKLDKYFKSIQHEPGCDGYGLRATNTNSGVDLEAVNEALVQSWIGRVENSGTVPDQTPGEYDALCTLGTCRRA